MRTLKLESKDTALVLKDEGDEGFSKQISLSENKPSNLTELDIIILALADKMENQKFLQRIVNEYLEKYKK